MKADEAPRQFDLRLKPGDIIATGNEWISLPTVRASDGALTNFNVLSMQDRGLLQVSGSGSDPAIAPWFKVGETPFAFTDATWRLTEYWIPEGRVGHDGIEATVTYCAPHGSRAALIRLTMVNHRGSPVEVGFGLAANFGSLQRVTYTPVELRGERTVATAGWMDSGEVFSFITSDTKFAWALLHPDSSSQAFAPPITTSPRVETKREATLAPGESVEADFILGVGLEEFSAPHSAKALREMVKRYGAEAVIAQAAQWCRSRTRTTGKPDLDMLMNRNLLFTANYAWGKTIDTEQLVGVTSRSPRYYVSAAYWDRDAMLWSFPGLLDIDSQLAQNALEYAFTIQLGNTGVHSRFIDGTVLEDGFQLDEAAAPAIASAAYLRKTADVDFLAGHKKALLHIYRQLLSRRDPGTGLFSSLQDSQDEFQTLPFLTYANVLTWRALLDLSEIFDKVGDKNSAQEAKDTADGLKTAILKFNVADDAPGAGGAIFVSATDGHKHVFTDIPPGSLMKLPALGFIDEKDPLFARTYNWLHSGHYQYSYSDKKYGLPGSYRLPFTTSWTIADHLRLARSRDAALQMLRASDWDAGIISEGFHPETAVMDSAGGVFATAAGYMGHAICDVFCNDQQSHQEAGPVR